ncbi:MAG TPA: beta-phosphoglucomutase [Lachnospiraceae bacterium]|nr:beta-phosphoglucomutase [Lachnospiraceae bacterium]
MDAQAVIFDLDGVLVHTDRFHYLAWKELSDEMGIRFDEEVNERLRGVSRMQSLEIILERYEGAPISMEEKEKLAEKKNSIYRQYLSGMTPKDVSDEVRDTLKKLRERGLLLAVGSSSKNAGFILEKTGLSGYFDAVSDGTMITRTKPDPEVFLIAAQLLHTPPEKCLVVEDADAGIEAGRAGGMLTAAYGAAKGNKNADYNLESFSGLLILTDAFNCR